MRYALRKQEKIKEVLGKEYLENNILQSLNKYFGNNDDDRILWRCLSIYILQKKVPDTCIVVTGDGAFRERYVCAGTNICVLY